MRWISTILVFSAVGWAQPADSKNPAQAATAASAAQVKNSAQAAAAIAVAEVKSSAQSAMAVSLEKQRVSVTMQVGSLLGLPATPAASFFTVPWIDFPSFVLPPCDPLPNDQLDKLIQQSSKQESVQPDLVRAVIEQESGGRPCAISSKGAQGLMQLMPSVVAQFTVRDPFDPEQNVAAGVKLLKQLLGKYNGDIKLTLAAYNAGSGRVESEGGVPAIAETINYVDNIVSKLPKQ